MELRTFLDEGCPAVPEGARRRRSGSFHTSPRQIHRCSTGPEYLHCERHSETGTDRFEHVISGGMAELVVDFSQMFHIDDSQTKGLVVSLGKIDEIGKDLARFAAV